MGVSLADHELVERIVEEGEAIGRPPEDTLEALFTELRPHEVEILVHPEMLAGLITGGLHEPRLSVYDTRFDPARRDLFRYVEQTFLSTFGFLLPKLVWVPTHAQAPNTMAVRIGTWRSLPIPTPPADKRLVLAPPWAEQLRDAPLQPSFHPVTGQECAIVPDDDKLRGVLEERGLVTWGPVDFTAVVLGSELSRRLPTLLGMEEVEYQLSRLSPDPGRVVTNTSLIALTRFTLGDLTRIFRALVAEHLSIVDLGGLLERLVQYETVEFEYEIDEPIVIDERLPVSRHALDTVAPWRLNYAFLRRRLRPYLTHYHGGPEETVYARTLDPRIEDVARRTASKLDDDELSTIRDAVWQAFADDPADSAHVVLTKAESRQPVRELLAPEFPDLPVLAIAELKPDVVRHLGRIAVPQHAPQASGGA
jgi:type III secretory pathway component EscV